MNGARDFGLGLASVLVVAAVGLTEPPRRATAPPCRVEAAYPYFSPGGGCTAAAVATIDQATATVRVLAYSFTSGPIADALVRARARGVDVAVILDGRAAGERGGQAVRLAAGGVPTRLDRAHAIAHNKVVLVDGRRVVTGSFNFTAAAERSNGENLVVIDSADLAARYRADWERHRAHSGPIGAAPTRGGP